MNTRLQDVQPSDQTESDSIDRSVLDELAWSPPMAGLDSRFQQPITAAALPEPYFIAASADAAALLGIDAARLHSAGSVAALIGNRWPDGASPAASVYSGHQFGVWAGQLGDGRAVSLGTVETCWELQLKGAGRTPYSRGADGRAVLRSSIREFLCSEAMAGLGIPTTRALALVGSSAPVFRERRETAAVVCRMAPSFVRFGHFEHFSHQGAHDALRVLSDRLITAHFPALRAVANPALSLLETVVERTAELVAAWQSVGFCHGVLNTDNMSILGLTIDYGPFGFIDGFDAHHVCNHSDGEGRYSYANQPGIGEWNCAALAQALLPLIGPIDAAREVLARYRPQFAQALDRRLRAKLGLFEARRDDQALFDRLFAIMHAKRLDFSLLFRRLALLSAQDGPLPAPLIELFAGLPQADPIPAEFHEWIGLYRARLREEGRDESHRVEAMNRVNPCYVLRNHLAEGAIRQAEASAAQASSTHDFSETCHLLGLLRNPFTEQPGQQAYSSPAPDWAAGLSVSCSS